MPVQNQKNYIGVDVSKMTLDVCTLPDNVYKQFSNDAKGVHCLLQQLQLLTDPHVVMEATGGYEKLVANELAKAGLAVAIVNPRLIRDFGKALGHLAKTDKIDANIIAIFAEKIAPSSNVICDENQEKMAEYHARRRQLITMIGMEKNRLDKVNHDIKKRIQRHVKSLEKEINEIDEILEKTIQNNEHYKQKAALLSTIKGVGKKTVSTLLAQLPELGLLSSRQIAALAGVAPYNCDSGSMRGKRIIWGGRATVRKGLYMATLVATKHNKQIKDFYERLCTKGKAKKVALIACMRKLIVIMNAMVKNNAPWNPAIF